MTPAELRNARNILGLSTKDLSEKIRMTQRAIQLMEAGRRPITTRTASQILGLLEVANGITENAT